MHGRSSKAALQCTTTLTTSKITKITEKNSGRKSKVLPHEKQLTHIEASKGSCSVREIRNKLNLEVNIETIRFVLYENKQFVYCKPLQTPWLAELYRFKRLEWTQTHLRFTSDL